MVWLPLGPKPLPKQIINVLYIYIYIIYIIYSHIITCTIQEMSNGIKHAQVITSLCYRLKLLTDTKLTGVRRFTQLQHIYSINRVISSFEKSGIEVTPSRISSNSRMTWVLANESAHGGAAITAMARRAQLRPSAPTAQNRARSPMSNTYSLLEVRKDEMNLKTRLVCCSLKGLLPVIPGSSVVCVVYGIPSVRRTDLFHSTATVCADLLTRYQVWQPYHEQQYVCSSCPLTLADTTDSLLFKRFTWDTNTPFLYSISHLSLRSGVIIFPKCFMHCFHITAAPFKVSTRVGGSPLDPTRITLFFSALNKTL